MRDAGRPNLEGGLGLEGWRMDRGGEGANANTLADKHEKVMGNEDLRKGENEVFP